MTYYIEASGDRAYIHEGDCTPICLFYGQHNQVFKDALVNSQKVCDFLNSETTEKKNSDFDRGRQAVKDEIKSGDIYDIPAAYQSFKGDNPDSEFQWGYFSALHDLIHFEEITDYDE